MGSFKQTEQRKNHSVIAAFYRVLVVISVLCTPQAFALDLELDPDILTINDLPEEVVAESSGIEASSTTSTGAQMMPGYYSEFNAGSQREEIAESAGEFIDPFTGSLNLRHTDVSIPGSGGFDLNVIRTYSSNNVYKAGPSGTLDIEPSELMQATQLGAGWEMHFGRIRRQSSNACSGANGSDSSSSPILETSEGSQKQLVYNNALASRSNAVYVTADYWHAYCLNGQTGLLLVDPNGTTYWMTHRVFSASRYFGLSSYVWYVSKIRDRNGNEMNFFYDSSSSGEVIKPSRITTSDNREITFEYANNKLSSISYNGKNIHYIYGSASGSLIEVQYPESRARKYAYYLSGNNKYLLQKSTRRAGGYTTYDYRYICKAITGCGVIRNGDVLTTVTYNHAISSKVENDINGNASTWGFSYSYSNGFDFTTATFPGGKYVYKHNSGIASSNGGISNVSLVGLLVSKSTYGGDSIIQTESYGYQTVTLSTQNTSRFPGSFYGIFDNFSYSYRVTSRTINRGGKNYVTSYQNFSDGRNPHAIVETGDATRTKTLSYKDISPYSDSPRTAYLVEDESYGTGSNRNITRTYDSKGRLTNINEYGVATNYTYFSNGDVATKKDALGKTVSYSNYYRGEPRSEALPEGITLTRTVTADGWVTSEKNGRGHTASYQYDALGRIKKVTPARGSATTMAWSKSSSKDVQTITRGGRTQILSYDGFGRVTCDQREGVYAGTVFDSLGRVTRRTYPNYSSCTSAQDTNFTYDILGRISRTTHVDGAYSQYTYQNNNKVQLRDETGQTFNFQYRSYADPDAKLLMSTTGPENLSVLVTRNSLGQETEINRNGKKRAFNYGATRFVLSEVHPETGTTTYTRDAIGNIKTKRVGGSGSTVYTYDDLYRLVRTNYPAISSPDVVYTYDKNSNLTRLQSGITDFTYVYDQNNNLTQENQKIDGTTYSTKYAYTSLDYLSTLTYHDNVVVSYVPNDLGWPTKASPYVTKVNYHPNGAPSQITYQNGRKSTFTLNNRQWSLRSTTDGGISDQGVTSYDGVGNITQIRDYRSSVNNRTLGYDGLHRLKTATGPWGTGAIDYSNTGDITSKRMGGNNLTYSYAGNKISSVSGLPNFMTNASYTYDAYGNVTKKQSTAHGWTYTYDDASNLRTVYNRSSELIRSFDYSGNNMKVKSVSPAQQRHYIYANDGNLLSNVKITGAKPTIHNIYLGSTLVAEVERNVTNPNSQISAESGSVIYGYGYGGNNHKHFVRGYFDLTEIKGDVKVCVNGYGIDSATEVAVNINGHSLGFLENGRTCYNIPSNLLLVGRNIVTFTQSNPGNTWGVSFSSVGNANIIIAPIIMLLLLDEEGV
jgi:YD repeat-containing protein